MAPLKIVIIGAGIAGLSAAIALRQQGHAVTLLEKSSFLHEVGAAINVTPNCTRLLQRLGLDTQSHGGNPCVGFAQYDGDGIEKRRVDMREFLNKFESPFSLIHRADLHDALKKLAMDEELGGPLPELNLGCRIQDVDVAKATVTLEDGRRFEGDLVVGADGAHSFCRKEIEPLIEPFPFGKSCYRWIVPRKVLEADPETAPLVDSDGCLVEISEGSRRIVMYPCRDNTAMNIAAFVPNGEVGAEGQGFNQSGSRAKLIKSFEQMCPAARRITSFADADVKVWVLYDMQSLPSWTRGRLVLAGDAAHPFLPFLGQGGAMAIEDAVCIARLLPVDTPASKVEERMKLYEGIRYKRAGYVREQTRRNGLDEEERPSDAFAMLQYCYQHDEWRNSDAALEAWLANDLLPLECR